jgi:outer membrane protein TolC
LKRLFLLLPLLLNASILSDIKNKEFSVDKQKSIKEAKETKNSWINPIMLQSSITKDTTQDIVTTTKQISISINQPIFKSGAIYYSIKYAKYLKNYNLTQIELQRRALIKQAYDLAYDYNIALLNKKILKLQIDNAKIDVERKKEAYLNGTGDSSQLDNAILNLNSLKLSLEDMNSNLAQIEYSFKKLSNLDIQKVKLPYLRLISKDKFVNENLDLKAQKEFAKSNKYLYKMNIGNSLVTVSLNGSYNYQEITNKFQDSKNNYYTISLSASLPIDINAKTRIEKSKLSYIKSKLLIEDTKNSLIQDYNLILSQIKTLKRKLKIYDENIKIYDNLINTTKESIKAGNATPLDLKILKNSKMAAILNKRIVNLQIQKNLLNLYYKLVSFSNKEQ